MQKRRIYLLIALIVLTALACNAILPQNKPTIAPTQLEPTAMDFPHTQDEVPRISAKDAKAAFDSGQAVIVDVRGAEFFKQSHVAGALNIPLADIEINPAGVNLDQNQWIITYCT
jgi:3-mercaptopyruvate sulfurtransferase SseA